MSITTIQVVQTEDARWAVESDDPHGLRSMYLSRDEAISAGVRMAITEDAVLVIEGADEENAVVMDCKKNQGAVESSNT